MSAVNPFPEGYPAVIPALIVDGAARAIDFYKHVFGAAERYRLPGPDGKIAHAELQFRDSMIMLGDAAPSMGFLDPKAVGGTPVNLYTYVEDADGVHAAALGAGAKELQAPATQFYGDRTASFEDPFGHHWTVSTHVEDVSPEEMEKRVAQMG